MKMGKILLKDVYEVLEKISIDIINELCPDYSEKVSIKMLHDFLDGWAQKNFTFSEDENKDCNLTDKHDCD